MGPELLVGVIAVVIAVVALVKSKSLSEELRAECAAVRSEGKVALEALESRLGESVPREGGTTPDLVVTEPSAEGRQVRALVSTVQVLELRAREHDALLCSLVSEDEARHLWNISRDQSILYQRHPGVEDELRSLLRRGLIEKKSEFMIHELPASFDVTERFLLSETGEVLLSLRKHLEASDTIAVRRSMPPRSKVS
jgi:hypothetical protein